MLHDQYYDDGIGKEKVGRREARVDVIDFQ